MAYTKGKAVKLSTNFKSTEFDCKCNGYCKKTIIDSQLVTYLQLIRNHFGKPITINSGYRCAKHNRAVGGSSGSKHTKGAAADIVVRGVEPKEVAKYCEAIGIKGIGLYSTFVHIDTRSKKSFWYGHNQEYRATFGGLKSVETVAKEVIAGKWGNGSARKSKLTKAGYNYNEVQKAVNKLLKQK